MRWMRFPKPAGPGRPSATVNIALPAPEPLSGRDSKEPQLPSVTSSPKRRLRIPKTVETKWRV